MNIKILFVDDDPKLRTDLVKIFNGHTIGKHTLVASEVDDFEKSVQVIIDNDYDIIILDLYKGEPKEGGEKSGLGVLKQIQSNLFAPVIFFSGLTKDLAGLESEVVGVVNKGHEGVDKLNAEIERMVNSNIALIKIKLYQHVKESLRKYFWDTVHADKKAFEPIKNDISLGYLLLRRIANSLSKENIKNLLGDDKIKSNKAHPMEFYIYPSGEGEYEAGEILKKDGHYFAILTPTCDFVEDKDAKRDRRVGWVLLAVATPLTETEYYKDYKKNSNEKNKERLARVIETRKGDQFFFLPGTPFMENLLLDFQVKQMVPYAELSKFTKVAKLDSPFAQSMISSFIRFYNRIGSPDIDSDYVISSLK
jgi:CheY-like chemotaxis protein